MDHLVSDCIGRADDHEVSDSNSVNAQRRPSSARVAAEVDVVGLERVRRGRTPGTWPPVCVRAGARRVHGGGRRGGYRTRLSVRISEPQLVAELPPLRERKRRREHVRPPRRGQVHDQRCAPGRGPPGGCGTQHRRTHIEDAVLEASLAIEEARTGLTLDAGQRSLVGAFATSKARLAVGIGPAGSGKTTAMRAFTHAWSSAGPHGGRVVPLATSSKAAQVLGSELGLRAENVHKFLHENGSARPATPGTSEVRGRRPGR